MRRLKELLGIGLIIIVSILLYSLKPLLTEYVGGLPKYLAVFLISFIGALSVIVPIPYTAILFVMASMRELDPLLTAIVAGLGSGLGEVTGWLLGRFMSKTLESTKYMKQIVALAKVLSRTKSKLIISLVILIFALTPLPDDILFIALGMLRYSLHQALIPCIFGKMLMIYLITMFGNLVSGIGEYAGLSESLSVALSVGILIILLVLLMFIKWDRILEKYLPQ